MNNVYQKKFKHVVSISKKIAITSNSCPHMFNLITRVSKFDIEQDDARDQKQILRMQRMQDTLDQNMMEKVVPGHCHYYKRYNFILFGIYFWEGYEVKKSKGKTRMSK